MSTEPDVWRDFLPKRVKRAEKGDTDDARELMWEFVMAAEYGSELPRELTRYLSRCFLRYLTEGARIQDALNIKKPAHRPREDLDRRDVRLAMDVIFRMRDGAKYEEAIYEASELRGKSESTVKNAYSQYREVAERLLDSSQVRIERTDE